MKYFMSPPAIRFIPPDDFPMIGSIKPEEVAPLRRALQEVELTGEEAEAVREVLGWLDDLVILWLLWRVFYAGAKRWPNSSSGQAAGGRTRPDGNASGGTRPGGYRDRAGKDPYEVLGISPGATREEIKSAYRRLVATYHPDKVAHLGDEFRKLAEERFKEVQEAYRELKR